jgi:hypothetical protein
MIYQEGPNDQSKDHAGEGKEQFMNRGDLFLNNRMSTIKPACLNLLTKTRNGWLTDHQNAETDMTATYAERAVMQAKK